MNILPKVAFIVALLPAVVHAAAERIIALSPHGVEMLFAIGAGEHIVATTDHADYPPSAKLIPSIGGYYGIQMERVLELKPDLIVTWAGGNRAEDLEMLKKFGFTTFSSNPTTLDAVADELIALGKLTGNEAKARQVADEYRAKLAALRQANQNKPKVKLFYQLWGLPLMTVSQGSWIQQIIEVCQGDNLFIDAKGEYPLVSIEAVLKGKPELILISQEQGNAAAVDWSQWPEVPAVENKQIYQLNADLLHRAGPRAIEGIESLCAAIDKAR